MNFSFNLANEPWIPVIRLDSVAEEVSLRDLLVRAHELREIFDPSPPVTLSLYRLAITVLHRVFNVDTDEEWIELWNQEAFPAGPIDEYFNRWKHRFDLFDEEYPFWQAGKFVLNNRSPVTQLLTEGVSGNNPILFDHSFDEAPFALSPAEAARKLLATQMLALGMGISGIPEIDGIKVTDNKLNRLDTPLVRGSTVILQGRNLHQTLTLNLLMRNFRGGVPNLGLPLWEMNTIPIPGRVLQPKEYLRYLTVLARWIRLLPEHSPKGEVVVKWLYLAQGESVPKDFKDPFKRYLAGDKEGWSAMSVNSERALWRDSAFWFEVKGGEGTKNHPPETLRQVQSLLIDEILQTSDTLLLRVIGLGTKPGKAASLQFWRSETLLLPLIYLQDESLVLRLSEALNWAETVDYELRQSVRALFHHLLAPSPERKADPDQVSASVNHLAPARRYWPLLEGPFYRLLNDLPEKGDEAIRIWLEEVFEAMRTSFKETVNMLPQRARELEAAVIAEGILNGKISKIKSELPLFQEEEILNE